VRLAGNLQGEAWLREWLTDGRDVAALGAALLVPSAAPPAEEGAPVTGLGDPAVAPPPSAGAMPQTSQ